MLLQHRQQLIRLYSLCNHAAIWKSCKKINTSSFLSPTIFGVQYRLPLTFGLPCSTCDRSSTCQVCENLGFKPQFLQPPWDYDDGHNNCQCNMIPKKMTIICTTNTFSWPAVSHIWYLYTTMSNVTDFVKNAALQHQIKILITNTEWAHTMQLLVNSQNYACHNKLPNTQVMSPCAYTWALACLYNHATMLNEALTRSLAIAKRACDCCIILKSGSYTKAI